MSLPLLQAAQPKKPILKAFHQRFGFFAITRPKPEAVGMQLVLFQTEFDSCSQSAGLVGPQSIHDCHCKNPDTQQSAPRVQRAAYAWVPADTKNRRTSGERCAARNAGGGKREKPGA